MQQCGLAASFREPLQRAGRLRQGKIRSGYRREKPGLDLYWQQLWLLANHWMNGTRRPERLSAIISRPFLDQNSVVEREIVELLHQTAGPTNRSSHRTLGIPQTEQNLFTMLGQKSGASLKFPHLASGVGFHSNDRTDGIAVAPFALETK